MKAKSTVIGLVCVVRCQDTILMALNSMLLISLLMRIKTFCFNLDDVTVSMTPERKENRQNHVQKQLEKVLVNASLKSANIETNYYVLWKAIQNLDVQMKDLVCLTKVCKVLVKLYVTKESHATKETYATRGSTIPATVHIILLELLEMLLVKTSTLKH